jgi:hypothetical protein
LRIFQPRRRFEVDPNVVYISKLGKAYSLFVEGTDEAALRKELTEKGISKADVDSLVGDPKKSTEQNEWYELGKFLKNGVISVGSARFC